MLFMARCWQNWKCRERPKSVELWAFTMALEGLLGLTIHADSMGLVERLSRREEGCTGSNQTFDDFFCGTLHTCSGGCVSGTIWRGVVLGGSGVCVHRDTAVRHTTSLHVAVGRSTQLDLLALPSLPVVCWRCVHRQPTALGTNLCLVVCLWVVDAAAGLVPLDRFTRLIVVVLVACTPEVGWSSWWASAR